MNWVKMQINIFWRIIPSNRCLKNIKIYIMKLKKINKECWLEY